MKFLTTSLPGLYLVKLQPHFDERGWFARTFCKEEFNAAGISLDFVQLNQSFNDTKGTFRGLHYQIPPFAEKKLVRCISGGILDFVVDIRKGSPTFLQHTQIELSAANRDMLLIPEGMAHGFLTLENNTSLIYHHTAFHNASSARGLRHDDPRLSLAIPVGTLSVVSPRDLQYPFLSEAFCGLDLQ